MDVKIDVLTISKRTGWEETAIQSLKSQTNQNYNWVVVTTEQATFELLSGYATVVHAPPMLHATNLNASHNVGLRHCTSKYVMFYQDFIELQPDTIERFLSWVDDEGVDGFISSTPYNVDGGLDHRNTGSDYLRECDPKEWEINLALGPLKALKEVGGFEEELDTGWSWDNVNVAERAALLGYKFHIDEGIKPTLLYHKKEPDANPNIILNDKRHEEIMAAIRSGERPIKCDYLL